MSFSNVNECSHNSVQAIRAPTPATAAHAFAAPPAIALTANPALVPLVPLEPALPVPLAVADAALVALANTLLASTLLVEPPELRIVPFLLNALM